jgi:hypothetical protein
MSELAQGLLMQAMELPEADRRWLGERLLDAEDADEFPDAPHHDPEFLAELIRRSDEVHAHPERLVSTDDGFARIDKLLGRLEAK